MQPALPDELLAKPGDKISPKWRRLQEWAKTFRIFSGSSGVRMVEVPGAGTWIEVHSRRTWDHPWRVHVSASRASIGYGTIEGVVPFIVDPYSGSTRRIDGTDEAYLPHDDGVPELLIEPPRGGDTPRTFLGVRLVPAEPERSDMPWVPAADPEALQLVHLEPDDLPHASEAAFHTLAVLYWSGGRLIRTQQVAYHHYRYHRVARGTDAETETERPPYHHFSMA